MAIKAGQLREKEDFQKLILEYLENENGYIRRDSKNFNAGLAMDTDILFKFLNDTQADEVEALRRLYGEQTEETIINYLNNEINKDYRSLIDVLKNESSDQSKVPAYRFCYAVDIDNDNNYEIILSEFYNESKVNYNIYKYNLITNKVTELK